MLLLLLLFLLLLMKVFGVLLLDLFCSEPCSTRESQLILDANAKIELTESGAVLLEHRRNLVELVWHVLLIDLSDQGGIINGIR